MSGLTQQLAQYAAYHRNPRNVATHCLGIPMIILGLDILLSRPLLGTVFIPVTPALLLSLLLSIYYLKSSLTLGAVMTAWLLAFAAFAWHLAMLSFATWLWSGLGLLIAGWILQFIGHYYEGRKPAFFDDLRGLLIGPGFIAVELLNRFGLFRTLSQRIQEHDVKPGNG